MVRNKDGQIEWVSSPVLKTVRNAKQELSDERPWVLGVGRLAVSDCRAGRGSFDMTPVAVQVIDGLSLTAEKLSTESGKKGTLALKSRINRKGSLKVDGSVQLIPFVTALNVETTGGAGAAAATLFQRVPEHRS